MLNTLIVIRQCLLKLLIKAIKKYTKILERVSSLMNTELDSKPVYGDNDKYVKTKIKTYGNKVNTSFQGKNVLKENASYKCSSLIMLDSVIRANNFRRL